MAALDGCVALVTGGSSGIGAETARRLNAEGCTIVVNARSDDGPGPSLAAQLGGSFVAADVSDPAQAQRLVGAAVGEHGRLDVVVNSAGTTEVIAHDDLGGATAEVWHRLYAVNVVAPWTVTAAARPWLEASPIGAVGNVGSLAGIKPGGSSIPYGVSKAALHQQTRMLAVALAPAIRVNAVAPGIADTPWIEGQDGRKAAAARDIPMGRMASADDVAAILVAQVLAPHVTGAVWRVDGGAGLVG